MLRLLVVLFKFGFQILGSSLFPLIAYFAMATTFPHSIKRVPEFQQYLFQFVALTSLISVFVCRFRPRLAPYATIGILIFAGVRVATIRMNIQGLTPDAILATGALINFAIITQFTLFPLNLLKLIGSDKKKQNSIKIKSIEEAKTNEERGRFFEEHVAGILRSVYGNAETTANLKARGEIPPMSGDKGADIIFYRTTAMTSVKKVLVQCKYYSGKVDIKAVHEVVGAKAFYHADDLMVVTNSILTKEAMDLAIANCVQVIQGSDLKDIQARMA
ncbi:restriction endonuclease [Bdellovibrio sp. HCB209]|uniref:restriction endonuclease n=1 Tax=Bdellovibrio sp. HCB209 TaxID=3394354 RepID=UPI0039B6B1F2